VREYLANMTRQHTDHQGGILTKCRDFGGTTDECRTTAFPAMELPSRFIISLWSQSFLGQRFPGLQYR
jgi:hypothetical protein